MPNDDELNGVDATSVEDAGSTKEKVVAQSLRGGDIAQEDASRSTLHYGEGDELDVNSGAPDDTNQTLPDAQDSNVTPQANGADTSAGFDATDTLKTSRSDQQPAVDLNEEDGTSVASTRDAQSATTETPRDAFSQTPARNEDTNLNSASIDAVDRVTPNAENAGEAVDSPDISIGPIQEANQAPTEIILTPEILAENSAGAVVGNISVIDADTNDQHSLTISDDRFEISGHEVRLKPGVSLDYETESSISFDVTATDSAGASYIETFQVTVSDVNEAPTDVTIDQALIATDQAGFVVGRIDVIDPDLIDTHTIIVSDDRFEVSDGQLKLREDVTLDQGDLGTLSIDVTVVDQGGETVSQTLNLDVIDTPDVSVTAGFRASYFDVDHSLSELDQIDWSGEPTHEEVVGEINYQNSRDSFWEGGSSDTFGARITGNIDLNEGGSFEFFLGGDDGAVLFIDGKEVIDNDGLHGYRTRTAEVDLEPGTHSIEVRYFENYGHAGLKLEWEGPGTDGRELVVSPDVGTLQTVNGMPITVDLQISDQNAPGSDVTSHHIDGLPEGTVVMAGGQSAVVGENGSVEISEWDTSVLSITTPVEFVGEVSAQVVTTTVTENGASLSTSTELDFSVTEANIPPPSATLGTGFRASYFDVDHSLSELDQIDWSGEPTHEEVVGEINYQNSRDSFWEGGSSDTFGARITGNIDLKEGGSFDFFLGGDDGAVLFIDGKEVIDNDGLHGYRTRTAEVDLEPGTHSIEVRYFENYGHAGLKLEWEGPGTDGRELVASNDDLSLEANEMIAVEIDTSNLSDTASVQITGLPADTILMSDDNVAISDGGEIDLSGWDLSLLEIAPPPNYEGQITGEIITEDTAFNGSQVSATTTFSIDVGDVERQQDAGQNTDANDLWMAADEPQSSESWVDVADNDTSEIDHTENAMDEEIATQSDGDQSHEMNETYERHDW